MTFLGFSISPAGDLIDLETGDIIERGLMSKDLYADLQTYGALSSRKYDEQDKYVAIVYIFLCSINLLSTSYVTKC